MMSTNSTRAKPAQPESVETEAERGTLAVGPGRVEGTLVEVTVSGDAYLGQAELEVVLDGKPIGQLRVAARHELGEWSTLSFSAPGIVDPKRLELRFLEDAETTDEQGKVIGHRSLWVAKVEVNGHAIDALAGRNEAVGATDPSQAHGYELPREGTLRFDLGAAAVPESHDGGVAPDPQRWFDPTGPRAVVEGRSPDDVAVLHGASGDFDITLRADGGIEIVDMNRLDGDAGTRILHDVRWAHFDDRTLDLGGVWLARALAEKPIDKAFYVAPDGDDRASGSREHPFATLERARDEMRENDTVNTTYVLPGHYFVDLEPGSEPDRQNGTLHQPALLLEAEDSGVRFIGLAGPDGERPVLHGGFEIGGFEKVSEQRNDEGKVLSVVWKATPPVGKEVHLDLTMKGERVFPAMPGGRSAENPDDWMFADKDKDTGSPNNLIPQDKGLVIPEGSYIQVFNHHWRWQDDIFTVVRVSENAKGQQVVELDRSPTDYGGVDNPFVYRLIGHPDFVGDHAGDATLPEFGWSKDQGLLFQTITETNTETNAETKPEGVVAAEQISVVRLDGADNVILHGLAFADTRTPTLLDDASEKEEEDPADMDDPAEGEGAAAWLEQAAVSLDGSDDVLISESVFRNVGRGIHLHDSSSVRVLGNEFRDLGRSGVVVRGDSDGALVAGNRFDDVGEVIVGYAAIDLLSAGEVDHTTLAFNTVTDASRSAVTMGDESVYGRMYGTRIENNHIENVGTQAGDAGGIHFLAQHSLADSVTRISGNIIKNISGIIGIEKDNGSWDFAEGTYGDGIYVDVAMHDTIVEKNLIEDVSNASVHIFGSSDVRVLNNYGILDRIGGANEDWQGDKFLYLQDRVLSEPVPFWTNIGSPRPSSLEIDFKGIGSDEVVFLNSIEINGLKILAPNPENPSEDDINDRYQWVRSDSTVAFPLPADVPTAGTLSWLDPLEGKYYSSVDNPAKDLVVLYASFSGDEADPPKFTIRFGESAETLHGNVPEAPTVDGIEVFQNVVAQQPLVGATEVGKDYIRFAPWNVPLESDNIDADRNLLFNVQPFTGSDPSRYTAAGFTEDQNSKESRVDPLVVDDSGRGYGLHPEVAATARKLGIEDLGSNGRDLWSRAGVDGFDWATYGGSFDPASAARGTPAGYTWDADQSQHVVYRDAKGHIGQLYYKADEQVWRETDLTADTGAPIAASSPAAYTWDVDPSQHVVYRDEAGHIQELFFRAEDGVFVNNDLTAATDAPLASGTPSGYTWDADKSQHVVYRAIDRDIDGESDGHIDGHIVELYYLASQQVWKANDLTEQAARQTGSAPPLAAGSPFGYVWDVDGAQHVVYRGVDGHIHELVRPADRDAWYAFDLTATTGAPDAAGDPVGYTWADDASQHIVYRDTDGHIQQLYYKAEEAAWKHTDLTRDTEAPLAAGSPDAYTWDEDASQHVVYRDRDGRILELYFKAEEGIWRVNDLSSVTGAPFAQGKPAGYSWDVDPSQHIVYASREGRIEELFFRAESGEWLAAELAPSPYLLPSWDEKAPLDTSDYERFAGVGAAELVLDAGADARIVFENEVAALDSVLGAYLIAPDGRIGPVGIVFPEIEHRDADPRYGARVRPGGGPLAEGDSLLLSDVFPDLELAPGQAFGLFLAAGAASRYGSALFASEAGSFRFVDKSGGEARVTSIDPDLLFTGADGSRIVIESPIFHTAQRPLLADPTTNPLNDGGRTQVLSGRSAQGDLELHFEDLPYSGADRDFNDLVVRVDLVI